MNPDPVVIDIKLKARAFELRRLLNRRRLIDKKILSVREEIMVVARQNGVSPEPYLRLLGD